MWGGDETSAKHTESGLISRSTYRSHSTAIARTNYTVLPQHVELYTTTIRLEPSGTNNVVGVGNVVGFRSSELSLPIRRTDVDCPHVQPTADDK